MKKENKEEPKKLFNWFIVASICYLVSAIMLYIVGNNNTMAVTNSCLAFCFLCLAISKEQNDKKNSNKK